MANAKKDSNPPLHPPYLQMINEAITTMKDRTGSSQPSIAKFIEENYAKQLPPNFRKVLSVQLKRFVKSEKLIKVKNSYKISAAEKEKKKQPESTKITRTETGKPKKTKPLSQIKTPEALKKRKTGMQSVAQPPAKKAKVAAKVKNKTATPAKRKASPKSGASPPAKKARK